jgi:putative hydrolase of the HAD superfamily
MGMIDVIALDADDTLWHSESLYFSTQERFRQVLARYDRGDWTEQALYETEMANLQFYGYGIKSFALSMIETAIKLTGGRIQGCEIQEIIDLAKEMLKAPIQLLDHVADAIPQLAATCPLMLITKGDLLDQETRLARSGLGEYFTHVEIVPDKTVETYRSLLERHRLSPERFLMVGNSLRSDVLPVVSLGGHAVLIPYTFTWVHEKVDWEPEHASTYVELEHIGLLREYVERICQGADHRAHADNDP